MKANWTLFEMTINYIVNSVVVEPLKIFFLDITKILNKNSVPCTDDRTIVGFLSRYYYKSTQFIYKKSFNTTIEQCLDDFEGPFADEHDEHIYPPTFTIMMKLLEIYFPTFLTRYNIHLKIEIPKSFLGGAIATMK